MLAVPKGFFFEVAGWIDEDGEWEIGKGDNVTAPFGSMSGHLFIEKNKGGFYPFNWLEAPLRLLIELNLIELITGTIRHFRSENGMKDMSNTQLEIIRLVHLGR